MTASPRVIAVDAGERLTILTCTPAPAPIAALTTCRKSLVIVGPDAPAAIATVAESFGWRRKAGSWRCNLHYPLTP